MRRKEALREAEGPESKAAGLFAGADQQVPRRCEAASLRQDRQGQVGVQAAGSGATAPVACPLLHGQLLEAHPIKRRDRLPDVYASVAADVLTYCRPDEGVWVDLGSGPGGLGLALASRARAAIVLMDPNAEALCEGLAAARERNLHRRVVAVVGTAESIPLLDESVALVASRGSIFFWQDQVKGLSEVYRVLRVGGKAMIGGGVGTTYPDWARKEFILRQTEHLKDEETAFRWTEARKPESFWRLARQAGLRTLRVLPDPPGLWLIFQKGQTNGEYY